MFVQAARRLASAGIASLRLDFMGSGDSAGDFVDCTIATQLADAHTALAWLREQDGVDPARCGVVGISLGGMIAALLLGDDPDLRAGVLLCPVGDPPAAIQRRLVTNTIPETEDRGWTDMGGYAVNWGFVHTLLDAKPVDHIVNTHAAVRLVHGDADETVDVADSLLYLEALQRAGLTCDRHVLEGADHNFRSIPWKSRVIDLAAEWFGEYLR